MILELFGSTGAGKSTLASIVLDDCRDQGINILMGDDFVLAQSRLNWFQSIFVRTLCIDLLALMACLATWRNNFKIYAFMSQVIIRLPVAWFEKLNLARNVFKKIGIYEIMRRRGSDRQILLVDEGTLHAVHNLFVHLAIGMKAADLATFVRVVPLPDAAIYVTRNEAILIDRTLGRGHKRIPDHSYASTKLFVKRALDTFDRLARLLVFEKRMMTIDSERKIFVDRNYKTDPALARVLKVVRAEAELNGAAGNQTGIAPDLRQ